MNKALFNKLSRFMIFSQVFVEFNWLEEVRKKWHVWIIWFFPPLFLRLSVDLVEFSETLWRDFNSFPNVRTLIQYKLGMRFEIPLVKGAAKFLTLFCHYWTFHTFHSVLCLGSNPFPCLIEEFKILTNTLQCCFCSPRW